MIPAGKPYITYRGRRYKDQERRLEATFGEGDYIPIMEAEEKDEGREFGKLLLKSLHELLRRIEN